MSSPIHKYLFSPPPSPPTRSNDWAVRKPSLTPIKLVSELLPNARTFDAERGEMKPRSPRTPQQRQFTLDNTYPSPYPSSPAIVIDEVGGTPGSATPKASAIGPSTPKRRTKGDKEKIASPPYLPANVPSSPIPIPSALPRPLVRLMVFASLVLSCILMLVFVPSARLPSLHSASVSRRLKLAPDGRAYLDVVRGANSWEDARDRDYQPPQIRVKQMNKRVPSREKRAVPRELPVQFNAKHTDFQPLPRRAASPVPFPLLTSSLHFSRTSCSRPTTRCPTRSTRPSHSMHTSCSV